MTTQQVRLYYARVYDREEDINIHAEFENKNTITFNKAKQFDYKDTSALFIYILDLELKKGDDGRLYVLQDNGWQTVRTFTLKGSRRVWKIRSVTYHEKNDKVHPLNNYIDNEYHFLLDVQFDSRLKSDFPGKNTNIFINLCLFTCFLLHEKAFNLFTRLNEQFQSFLLHEPDPYNDFDFADFFKYCERLLVTPVNQPDENYLVLQMILRMIGLVSIPNKYFDQSDKSSIAFTNLILPHVTQEFNTLYRSIDEQDRPLFNKGLVTLLCIKLIHSTHRDSKDNELTFLETMTDQTERQNIANELLKQLSELNFPIVGNSDWTILFTMVDPAIIEIQHLNLADCLETLAQCITNISKVLVDFDSFKELFGDYFEERLTKNKIKIDLHGLLFVVKFLEDNLGQNECLTQLQFLIQTSNELNTMTKDFFHDLRISDNNMKQISQIFARIYKYPFLQSIDVLTALKKSLTQGKSKDYYLRWFECFLAKRDVWMLNDLNERERYFFKWISKAAVSRPTFANILKSTDRLIASFDLSNGDDEFQNIFIGELVKFCSKFSDNEIDQIIRDDLVDVQNKFFRIRFTKYYNEAFVAQEKVSILKEFINDKNPLMKLIKLNRVSQYRSHLIRDLIEAACERIEITRDELIEAILNKPKKTTLTYMVLIEESFCTTKIRSYVISELINIWENWQTNGFQVAETNAWDRMKSEQRQIVCEIWKRTEEISERCIPFESSIAEANKKVQTVLNIKNSVKKCISHYCKKSSDYKHYRNLISKLDKNVDQQSVETFQLPEELAAIQQYTQRLNTVIGSNAWANFLKQQLEVKNANTNLSSRSNAELIYVEYETETCHDKLSVLAKIFDAFITYLSYMCNDSHEPIFPQLQYLFPDKQWIDKELKIMNSILVGQTISRLETLLAYWKNRNQINHFARGCINLCSKYTIEIQDTLLILQNVLNMDDSTTVDTCITVYQQYSERYLNKYEKPMFELISHWESSSELLYFLYSCSESVVDDLVEVINEWDEASMNTKTVLDFVLLTRLIMALNTKVESIRAEKTLTFDDIIHWFQGITHENEMKNILSSFESCSKNLVMIQHICSESKSKEQSKKRRILDIINNGQFCFCLHQSKETVHLCDYQFDVHTTNKDWEPISFVDLNDLRDRARLVQYAQDNGNDLHNYSKTDIEQLQLFISLVDIIEEVLQIFSSLYTSGYPVVKQNPMHRRRFACEQEKFDKLEQFKKTLAEQLCQWEKELCDKYKTCLNLTYLSYQQLSTIENAIRKGTVAEPTDFTYHLFKFMGVDPKSIQADALLNKIETPRDLLNSLAPVLRSKYDNQSFPMMEDEKIHKIFLIETTDSGILRAILSLFYMNEISPPVANQLFYCTRSTTWTEIRAFAYRCFYSQVLHQLIRPELLSIIIQHQMAQLLIELSNESSKRRFRLGIITNVPGLHLYLINSLRLRHTIHTVRNRELLNEEILGNLIEKLIDNRCMLVTSKISGLGKSSYIHKKIQQLPRSQVKFSISGDMNVDTLIQRLHDQKIQSLTSPIALHINIGSVEHVEQLNEFLYSLILFRCFRFNQTPANVPIDIPIFIELDSSSYLNSLQDTIVIFKYIRKQPIGSMNWDELESISPDIQLVANYLQSVRDKTINIKEINEETMHVLSQSDCISLLRDYLLSKRNIEFVSWTQFSIFISVYYCLFSGFSNCGHFLIDEREKSSTLRSDILDSLLATADYFISFNVETVRRGQQAIHSNGDATPIDDAIIRWDKTRLFTVIFTASYDPLFVYKTSKDIPPSLSNAFRLYYKLINKYQSTRAIVRRKISSVFRKGSPKTNAEGQIELRDTAEKQFQEFLVDPIELTHEQFFQRLASLSTKYFVLKSTCLKCFKQHAYDEQVCAICPDGGFLDRPDRSGTSKAVEHFQIRVASKLKSEYILTADNYIKMLLIYLRVESGLPVLIMGETGCGKTALIQFLCQRILNDEMCIFRIHAGVTNEQIVDRMREYTEKARKLLENDENKHVWVFFDEFNTTPNIGLLKEIICERTLLGESLPENMVFLGACNPQRRQTNTTDSDDNTTVKRYHSEKQHQSHAENLPLLYSVVSIPETMLEHVWDYGHLDKETEKKYIETMLIARKISQENTNWFRCVVIMISESQDYIRRSEDVSSVSLRDVSRFCRFYNWFHQSSDATETKTEQQNTTYFSAVERASLLALFLCYYFRLNSVDRRNQYLGIIAKSIESYNRDKPYAQLDTMLQSEKMSLVNRMELPPGTAANRALTDNIFVLYTCILNRIPVILCGKPGCSKTSAVQIVISNLRGKNSKDLLFQSKQELIAVSYQGSKNCTSDSIIKVFERADRYATKSKQMKLLPVIVFDEIGLAELSPHNPLKVLHSELEVENCRHGFVGLSNWRLDASKMNRAVYLACPEPDSKDLKTTATTLSKSMASEVGQTNPLSQPVIDALANVYKDTYEYMKKEKNQQYFGLRDYYSLIKGIVRDLLQSENKEEDLYKIVRHHLSCNFDDIVDGSQFMWSKFCEHMDDRDKIGQLESPTFIELLNHSLSSRKGRFLMLIGDGESAFDYAQRYINNKYPSLQTKTLVGSTFEGDFLPTTTYTEQYNTRVLMDIILYAEKEITLFLRGLGHLYDNLYDLFNQSYAVSAKKKYCRIALGSLYHPRCLVNDEFYCIVFVKVDELDQYDAPFLNRFEKHLIDSNSLIDQHHLAVISKLNEWINELLSNEKMTHSKDLFIWSRSGYIRNLVMEAFDYFERSNTNVDDENVLKYCQNQILRCSTFDLPLLLSLKNKTDHQEIIQQYYQIHTNFSLASFICEEFMKNKNDKLLVYTYTEIYETIPFNDIDNYQSWIEEVRLSEFRTELDLMKKLKMHNQKESESLLCIRIDYYRDHKHIPMLKYSLLNAQSNNVHHSICLIFHLQRCQLSQTSNDVFFDGWSRIMVDDLDKNQIIPEAILTDPSYGSLINHLKFFDLEKKYDELISSCIIKLNYTVANKEDEVKINKRRDEMIKQFTTKPNLNEQNSQSLYSYLKKHLLEMVQNTTSNADFNQLNDWRQDLIRDGIVNSSSRSVKDALMKIIQNFLDSHLSMFVIHLENYSLIDSFRFLNQSNQQIRKKLLLIWQACWDRAIKEANISTMNQEYTDIPLVFDLHLPCAMIEYDIIRKIRQTIAQIQSNNDNDDDNHRNEKLISSAYKQLNSSSIYGKFIDDILKDSDLFTHYYHDQITLTRNEANVYHLSTSFILRLLTSDKSTNAQDSLRHLFVNYQELFEIIKLFEISRTLFDDEDVLLKTLTQQLVISNDQQKTTETNNSTLCRSVDEETDSAETSDEGSHPAADPFIEACLVNLIELLISLPIVQSIKNIEQIITTYNLFIQCIDRIIFYGRYDIRNLEKFNSTLRLATCISNLFPPEQALQILKQVYIYFDSDDLLRSYEQINKSMTHLKTIIRQQQPSKDNKIVQETLLNFENELVTNWFMDHTDQCNNILEFIDKSQKDIWAYSARIFDLIDRSLRLVTDIRKTDGELSENEQYNEISQYLSQLNDPKRKMEVLLHMQVYTRLVLNKSYKPYITDENEEQITKILKKKLKFSKFERYLNEVNNLQDNERLDLISRIAWLKYYLLYYVYALKYDFTDRIMEKIDQTLTNNTTEFGSTVKLYIIKQLCQCENITFHDLPERYMNRRTRWIGSMIPKQPIILPLPSTESIEEFQRIDKKLSSLVDIHEMNDLIRQCSENQSKAYCFFVWFIHHYTRFYNDNIEPDQRFTRLEDPTLRIDVNNHFGQIAERFIYALCTNFTEKSFFRLKPSMSEEDLHGRLVILNMIALLLSFKCSKTNNAFSYLLFEKINSTYSMPQKYVSHFENLSHLIGVAFANDSALQQMLHIRTQINRQHSSKIDIFRCSKKCPWLFYIENSTLLDEHKQCPLCQTTTQISQNGDLFVMNQPHIPMDRDHVLELIDQYIANHEYKNYLNNEHKPSYLNQPISFHFINLLINSIFLFLHEFPHYLPGNTPAIYKHFQESVERNYTIIQSKLSNAKQFYLWFYQLFNHMIQTNITIKGDLSTKEGVMEFEKSIEEQLILPHIKSVTKEIRDYKSIYLDYLNETEQGNELFGFVEELTEDNERYPLFHFFNATNIHSLNIIQHFHSALQLQPNYQRTYPVTAFLLERINDYDNIPHLYSLIKFTNYLIQNFNSCIEREDARTIKISQFLKDHQELQNLYEKFAEHWLSITLKEVYFNQQKYELKQSVDKDNFAKQTNISMFLLNKSNANESLLAIACLHTIANLQNEILDYFHSNVINDKNQLEKNIQHMIPLQSIQEKHLYAFNIDRLTSTLFEIGIMINYQYGMSEEIFYNFDEIEWTLRNEISCLPKIDLKTIRYFNYQFELYDENLSLINDIRQRSHQELFDEQKRKQIKTLIDSLDNKSTLEISGSLEYILKYLQNVNNQNIVENFTIERFISEQIDSNSCIDDKFRRGILATIHLVHIIDLYELNEECIYEKILAKNIPQELCEASFPKDRTKIIEEFTKMTLENPKTADNLKDRYVWIGMFKRLLVRLLLPKMNINFESSLYDSIKRNDMWKQNITSNDIKTIEIKDDLCLKHAFIILNGLENKNKEEKTQAIRTSMIDTSDDEDDEEEEEEKNKSKKPISSSTRNPSKGPPKVELRSALRQRRR